MQPISSKNDKNQEQIYWPTSKNYPTTERNMWRDTYIVQGSQVKWPEMEIGQIRADVTKYELNASMTIRYENCNIRNVDEIINN